ncbi:MAG: hypothetical protein COA73_01055 [Candidatus Hydrogenedentota bacterium]|nr:MAG: hypothetical protein COA73_01055 [Candidatus Hydrogenedentota bacterium]
MSDLSSNEIVYVLTNPAMDGLVKIGKTNQKDIKSRMQQLYTTGVPFPFECEYACFVDDCAKVESAFHLAFGNTRINPKREFFRIEPEKVIAILKLVALNDARPQIEGYLSEDVSLEEKKSAEIMKASRRPPMNFEIMNVPIGSILIYQDGITAVEVTEPRKVRYNGEICSLTAATKDIMGIDSSIQPAHYWRYEGKTLKEIYEETYTSEADEI